MSPALDHVTTIALAAVLDEASHTPCVPMAKLATLVEWMRWCDFCLGDQIFVADRVSVAGLVGSCSKCGDRRVAPFTRTTQEEA